MSEEPDVGDYEEYVLSGIEDQASEEVAQKYQEIENTNKQECPKCEFKTMRKMTECHLICENCGAHMDCSDKGSVW
jgi:ribosomal protein L37AE/L43A